MDNLTNSLSIQIAKWKSPYRIIILLLLITIFLIFYALPYKKVLLSYGHPIQIFELYINMFSSQHTSLVISIIAFFVLGETLNSYVSKIKIYKSLLIGRWLFVVVVSFVICTSLLVFCTLLSAPYAYISNEWSIPSQIIANGVNFEEHVVLLNVINQSIIVSNSPINTMLSIFTLQLSLFIYIGILCELIQLFFKKMVIQYLLIVLNSYNWLIKMYLFINSKIGILIYLSPLYLGTYAEHIISTPSTRNVPSVFISILLLVVSSFIFVIIIYFLIHIKIKRKNLTIK